ncbi:hypothetical protein GALL_549870 [mine drainage metagenome]|uniref:Uncharacterized protein n=1 Tax=mine drainage metagenome TaxID=410659 RepID=A0A1J5NZ05_9ZZZZ
MDRQQRYRQHQQWGQKNGPDFARVASHGVAHKLANVVVDAPALAHRFDDGGKVVVQQHQAGSLARHVGAALAHGNPDVGLLEGRRVIDTVTGHGDKLAAALQRLHDTDFLCRVDPGVNAHLAYPLL